MAAERVADDEFLFRSVRREEIGYGKPERVNSGAFLDRAFRPSVDRAALCGGNPAHTRKSPTNGVILLLTAEIRQLGEIEQRDARGRIVQRHLVDVLPDPLPENVAHAAIVLEPESRHEKVFRRLRVGLAQLAKRRDWALPPPDWPGA